MTRGDFWNGGFGLGAEFGAILGLAVALLAMSIIRRRTRGQPFAAYGRSVWKLVLALTLVIGAMGGGFGWFLSSRHGAF